jgi:hypothetical protein
VNRRIPATLPLWVALLGSVYLALAAALDVGSDGRSWILFAFGLGSSTAAAAGLLRPAPLE